MINILILGGIKEAPKTANREYYNKYVDFFKRSASVMEVETQVATALLDDLIISVGDGEFSIYDTFNQCDLAQYKAIFFRGDGFKHQMDVVATINHFAKQHEVSVINDHSNVRDSSKLLQAAQFHVLEMPVARTLLVNQALMSNFDHVTDWEFPCIMKANHGSHGNDNYMVNSLAMVKKIISESSPKRYVLQRFVPNKGDFRILSIGEQTITIGRTAAMSSHLNNTSQGGQARLVNADILPANIIVQTQKICRYLGLSVAGVDVLQDEETGQYYFLEVNAQPQLMSGAFVEDKERLIGQLLQKLAHKS